MKLSLRPITQDNWRVCIALEVAEAQQNFVAPNVRSLAQAAYETMWQPHGVYLDDEMVGFAMYGIYNYEGRDIWDITRLMIDKAHQGKGYGTQAMHLILDAMRAEAPQIQEVYISFVPENAAARHVYSKIGFVEDGMMHGEIVMQRKLGDTN